MFRLSYKILLIFTVMATLGGLLTLIPWSRASYPNLIGYLSLCTFAPGATFYCFLLAGISCFVRSALIKDQSGSWSARIRKHGKSFIPLVLVLTMALFFTIRYIEIKAYYAETSSSATIQN